MSRESVDVIRAAQKAWNTGDMDALRELYDPDATMKPAEGWPESTPFVGLDAVMRQFEQMRSTFDAEILKAISDFIEVGDRVVVRTSWVAAGHGPVMNMEVTQVFTVRKGRVVALEFFWDHAEALAALELSERDA
jgi:ketosteroid isomerase-like protein